MVYYLFTKKMYNTNKLKANNKQKNHRIGKKNGREEKKLAPTTLDKTV